MNWITSINIFMDLFPSFNTYPIYVDIAKVEIQINK